MVPASVPAARQCLHALILSRIEDVVGVARLPEVESEVAKLAEAVLAADIDVAAAVKLLGGRPPDSEECRAASYGGKVKGGH
eukprot:692045-Pleurochrysis_carterae.AAC.1